MTLAPTTPVEGLRPPDQGPENNDRPTRPKLKLWDRVKFLLLFAAVWFLLVWAAMADNPLLPFVDAMRLQVQDATWLLVLFGIEVARQIHFFVSEHWSGYHRFWTNKVFGGSERFAHRRFSDWTRFRLARVLKWAMFFALAIVVIGAFMDIPPVLAIFQLPALLWAALPFIVQMVFILFIVVMQFVAIFWFLSRGGIDTYYPEDIKTRFADVWGQDQVVARVKENIVFLERPQEIEVKGGYVPSGLLLWGPPGTGKTLMAEAVAGETGKPYVFVDPGAFTNMFMGVGILKVKSLFRKLRKLALRYGGVIVFFDEADSLGSRGALPQGGFPRGMSPIPANGCNGFSYLSAQSQWIVRDAQIGHGAGGAPVDAARRNRFIAGMGMGGGAGMGTLQALLTELSGLKKPRGFINRYVRRVLGMRPKPPPKYRILVMMATNLPEALDEALLRPGRIDRIYKVGYPSKAGRVRTYEGYFNKVRHELTAENIDKLAVITPYATGATIKDLVNEALITAIRDGRDVITWNDVIRSKHLKDLGPPEDVEYIERERHAVAVHEACHAVMAYHVQRDLEIDLATIEKGSTYLGMVSSIRPEDQFTRWRSDYEADIHVSLASLAGERLFFDGDSSSGVSGDLESATSVASRMEGYWGMGSTVSSYAASQQLSLGAPGGPGGPGAKRPKNPDEEIRVQLADRIEDNLATLLEKTARMLREHRRDVLVVAHALESYKTLTGEDVAAVIEGRAGPTIDGTSYRDPEFLHELEAYHNAAAIAHQAHSKIPVPLPTPPETGPSTQWQPLPATDSAVETGAAQDPGWSGTYGQSSVDPFGGNGGPPRDVGNGAGPSLADGPPATQAGADPGDGGAEPRSPQG